MDDNQIISLFFERSEQAISELSNKYGGICLKIALNILNNHLDAEECINDSYLGVWKISERLLLAAIQLRILKE